MMASPKKLVAGVKSILPLLITAVPTARSEERRVGKECIVRWALDGPDRLSASVSLASTSMVTRVSSLVLAVLLTAAGALLRFGMVGVTLAAAPIAVPSVAT